jgi:hypothetical protein
MHGLLLDENITYVVATQVTNRRPDISIQSLFHWRGGALTGTPDPDMLQAAAEEGLTLVTYDVSTIQPLVIEWGLSGLTHAGVIFIDEWTIRSQDIGGIVRAIERFWDDEHDQDWSNRTDFLSRA